MPEKLEETEALEELEETNPDMECPFPDPDDPEGYHKFQYIRSNEDGDTLYRCRNCGHQEVI